MACYSPIRSSISWRTSPKKQESSPKIAYFSLWYPHDLKEAVSELNDGVFHQLLEKYKAKNWKHGLIYLGALSMRLGVSISKEDMQVLINALERTRMYDLAKWQMDCALRGYQNGEPWNFDGLGLVEEMRNGTDKYTTGHGIFITAAH